MGLAHTVDFALDAATTFEIFTDELIRGLEDQRLSLEPTAKGSVVHNGTTDQAGKVLSWDPPKLIELEWFSKNWEPEKKTRVKITFEPNSLGTAVTVTNSDWNASLFDDDAKEFAGWFATELVAPFLASTHHEKFGDWITDRRARRPSGEKSQVVYGDPVFHRPNFKAILKELSLNP